MPDVTKPRKINVFLSGIVNSTNAQNLNCLALSLGALEVKDER